MHRLIGFRYYDCPNCKHSRRWPWPSDPKEELGDKCENCGCKITWVESCIPD